LKKILVIGASGFIGNYFFLELKKVSNFSVFGTYYSNKKEGLIYLDYTNPRELNKILKYINPEIIIWAAGIKNIDDLESNHSLAEKHNLIPVKNLVKFQNKVKHNINLIFISSDYVFDGKKGEYTTDDYPNPDTIYGKSKLDAEHYIKSNSPFHIIIRVGSVIGLGSNFWDWIIGKLKLNQKIELYDDVFSPTPIDILYKAIIKSIELKLNGLYHVSGDRCMSRYDFGLLISKSLKTKSKLIKTNKENNFQKNRSLVRSKVFNELDTLDNFINSYKYD
tara:strand:- start:7043 stop:7876 length:834 start_codon:yes stop_codon:yes gene_type:complete